MQRSGRRCFRENQKGPPPLRLSSWRRSPKRRQNKLGCSTTWRRRFGRGPAPPLKKKGLLHQRNSGLPVRREPPSPHLALCPGTVGGGLSGVGPVCLSSPPHHSTVCSRIRKLFRSQGKLNTGNWEPDELQEVKRGKNNFRPNTKFQFTMHKTQRKDDRQPGVSPPAQRQSLAPLRMGRHRGQADTCSTVKASSSLVTLRGRVQRHSPLEPPGAECKDTTRSIPPGAECRKQPARHPQGPSARRRPRG